MGGNKTETAARNQHELPPALSNHRALQNSELLMGLLGEVDSHSNVMESREGLAAHYFRKGGNIPDLLEEG